jgi:integrase
MSVRLRTRKDGSLYWQVRFRENGVESSVSWDDPAEAEQFDKLVRQVGAAKAREICRIVAASQSRALTVRQYLERHNDSLTGIDPGTVNRYRAYVRNDIGPAFGDIPLTALSRDDVAAWINEMAEDGASGKTIKNKRDYLSGALKIAVKNGELTANPCTDVSAPRWDREEMVFLTHEEFQLLHGEVSEYWQPLVEFLVASGCRWSEATALKPAAVDRAAGTVRITKAWKTGSGGYRLGVPKTKKSVRTINVPRDVLDKLDYTGEWLFTNSGRGRRNPDGPVRIHSFHPNVWTPAVDRAKKAGLTKKPRVHDLRHTCASWLIQAGIPLPVVQRQLGHESINTTIDTYTHLDRTSGELAADAMRLALGGQSASPAASPERSD